MDEIHDYESLRIGGMIFAVILFLMGIFLIVSRKCRCKGNKSKPVGLDPAAARESYMYMDQSAFQYDYETLRTTGVILAVVMFVTGILIALSKKFKCSKSNSTSDSVKQMVRQGGPFQLEERLSCTKMWRRVEPA
ncbi:hypothetical protein cypCar_00030375 [Cyprinus carpio]|nr:hypothetical protein cypCar_00030375 [Cyprinus carpio]